MKPVRQEDPLGCGIACVAFVLGISYRRAKRYFRRPAEAERRGFFCRDIVFALKRAGKTCEVKCCRKKTWKPGTIVFIRPNRGYPAGHYLVSTMLKAGNRKQVCWMDPWLNLAVQKNFLKSKAGFRRRLPGMAWYAIVPSQGALL